MSRLRERKTILYITESFHPNEKEMEEINAITEGNVELLNGSYVAPGTRIGKFDFIAGKVPDFVWKKKDPDGKPYRKYRPTGGHDAPPPSPVGTGQQGASQMPPPPLVPPPYDPTRSTGQG
jgi:hypothetical protein